MVLREEILEHIDVAEADRERSAILVSGFSVPGFALRISGRCAVRTARSVRVARAHSEGWGNDVGMPTACASSQSPTCSMMSMRISTGRSGVIDCRWLAVSVGDDVEA